MNPRKKRALSPPSSALLLKFMTIQKKATCNPGCSSTASVLITHLQSSVRSQKDLKKPLSTHRNVIWYKNNPSMEVQTPYFKRRISRIRIMPLKEATSLELVTRVRIRNIIQLIACINLILIAPLSFQKK
jgi:hypothetical protein